MANDVEQRLAALGLQLPEAPQPVANYVPTLISGNFLYISGQIAKAADGTLITGILGTSPSDKITSLNVEQGQQAARICALNILAQARAALGNFEKIAKLVRLTGFVASSPDFFDHPAVINGASDLMVEALGDRGKHTRAAVGVAALPAGTAVEIDAIFQIE